MNRLIDARNVFKQITKEITAKCAAKGQTISGACALRIMKITMQNPEYDFGADLMTRSQIQHLITTCVNKLTESVGLSSRTIEMQVYFSSHYSPREQVVNDHRHSVLMRTDPLIMEIKETTQASGDEMKNLYRKVVVVITLMSGLGNPTATAVLKEATAALHSVFPLSELSRFMALSDDDKMKQIVELKQIVSGIRLFNRDCHKGGEGIDDMPSILQQAVVATKEQLTQRLEETEETLDELVEWLGLMYTEAPLPTDPPTLEVSIKLHPGVTEDDVGLLKENVVHLIQYKLFLKKLLEDVQASERDIIVLCAHVTERLLQLHDTVRYRTAIPTNQVYPQFMDLSMTWSGLQDQMIVLSTLSHIIYTLNNMSKIQHLEDEKVKSIKKIHKLSKSSTTLSPRSKSKIKQHNKIQPVKLKCEVLELIDLEKCDPKDIQYYGHCAFRFVETSGSLFPADLSIGLLRFKGLLFGFSSVDAAYTFGTEPDRYYQQGLEIVVRRPELIVLFDMDDQIQNVKPLKQIRASAVIKKCDSETQTDLHPVPSLIDPNYSWNIWDYKRQAIHLANICKSATHSTQTVKCHKRAHIGVQATPCRELGMQLPQEKATNTKWWRSYIVGLRGTWLKDQFMMENLWTYMSRCPSNSNSQLH